MYNPASKGGAMINFNELKLGTNASGDEIWVCGHCGGETGEAQTVDAQGHSAYTLMCRTGKITLGEWPTLEEKILQLTAYKKAIKKE
jgi:hypothetical protein